MSGAGLFRTPVTLERPERTAAPGGAAGTLYVAAGTDFAAIRLRRQDEAVAGARLDGVVSHEIRLRYRDDIAGGWRIRAGARVFRVLAASDPDLGRRQILCLVEEEGA